LNDRNHMKRILLSLILFFVFAQISVSQTITTCFEINRILVDACPSDEGLNEQVSFQVGPNALNTSDLQVVWPNASNSWSGVCQDATTTSKVAQLNGTVNSCGFFREPQGGVLPANSKVLLFTSVNADMSGLSFAGLTDTLYVIFHCGGSSAGNFANYGTGIRTLTMSFNNPSGCSDQVSYDRELLVNQAGQPGAENGATVLFTQTGEATYISDGCNPFSQPVSAAWTSPGNICNNDDPIDLYELVTGSPNGTFVGTGVSNGVFNPSGLSGNQVVSYIVGSGTCLVESQQLIIVNQGGDPSWLSPGALCGEAAPLNLNTLLTGTTGGTWSGNGVSNLIFFPSNVSGVVSITYTVGQGVCQSSSTQTISVVSTLSGPNVPNTTICSTVTSPLLTASAVPNATVNWYSNSALTNLLATGLTYSPAVGVNTTLYVTQTVAGCNVGVSAIAVSFIDPPSPPTLSTTSVNFCPGSPLPQLTATSNSTIIWYNNEALTQVIGTGSSFQPLESQAPTIFVVAGTSSCRSTPVQVNLNGQVFSATWNAPSAICNTAEPIELSDFVTGTAGGNWVGQGVSGSVFSPTGLVGPISITYTVGSGACIVQSAQTIQVNLGGDPAWTSPGTLCNVTDQIQLNDWLTGTPGGIWSGTGVTGSTFSPDGLNGPITLTYSVGSGICASNLAQTVNVASAVGAPAITGPTTFCDGQQPSAIVATVLQGAEVNWYSDAALTSLIQTGNGFVPTQNLDATYYVTQSFPGCASPASTVNVSFNETPTAPITETNIVYCIGQSLPTLSANGSGVITWYNDQALTEQVGTGASFTPDASILPDLFVQVSDGSCRSEAVQIQFSEGALVTAEIINSAPLVTCDFQPVVLSTDATQGILWSTGETTSTITIDNGGTYTLTVTGACNSATDQVVFIDNGVVADFDLNADNGIAPMSVVAVNTSLNADQSVFYLDDELSQVISGTPFVLEEEGEYVVKLVARNDEGCADSLTRTITVISGNLVVAIPNSFTPNGDGFNDNFVPKINGMAELSFAIFNRWGSEVVSWNDLNGKWDGSINGTPSPDGVYFYVMKGKDLLGSLVEKSGSITIKR
jgi:gliding motility-associated-like protein